MGNYDLAGLLAGMFFIILGVILGLISFIVWPIIFYALICSGIGIAIIITLRKQDEIEQIKPELKRKTIKTKRRLD